MPTLPIAAAMGSVGADVLEVDAEQWQELEAVLAAAQQQQQQQQQGVKRAADSHTPASPAVPVKQQVLAPPQAAEEAPTGTAAAAQQGHPLQEQLQHQQHQRQHQRQDAAAAGHQPHAWAQHHHEQQAPLQPPRAAPPPLCQQRPEALQEDNNSSTAAHGAGQAASGGGPAPSGSISAALHSKKSQLASGLQGSHGSGGSTPSVRRTHSWSGPGQQLLQPLQQRPQRARSTSPSMVQQQPWQQQQQQHQQQHRARSASPSLQQQQQQQQHPTGQQQLGQPLPPPQQQHQQQQHQQQQQPAGAAPRKLPSSITLQQPDWRWGYAPRPGAGSGGAGSGGAGSGGGDAGSGGGGSNGRPSAGSGGGGSSRQPLQPRWQQPQQQHGVGSKQQAKGQPSGRGPKDAASSAGAAARKAGSSAGSSSSTALPRLPWAGSIVYAATAADVDACCRRLLASGALVIGFDAEWAPSFVRGAPPNKTALLQLAYAAAGGRDVRPSAASGGRGCGVVLLLHIVHAGVPPVLQQVLLDDQIVKVGVNIHGDVVKMAADYGIQCAGTSDLSDTAHGRQLRAVDGVTVNVQPKRWSLAGLIEEVLSLHLPKPQSIRLGNWERRPLSREQQVYAAMDAWACLLLHHELQQLPTTRTLSQQLIEGMRQRAAAGAGGEEGGGATNAAAAAAAADGGAGDGGDDGWP